MDGGYASSVEKELRAWIKKKQYFYKKAGVAFKVDSNSSNDVDFKKWSQLMEKVFELTDAILLEKNKEKSITLIDEAIKVSKESQKVAKRILKR
ncbi:MAG: hypothetical protein ACXQS8_09345 [Candidatus Helarchaeales archaeon]